MKLTCLTFVFAVAVLGACAPSVPPEGTDTYPGLREAVKEQLRDPTSAQFRNIRKGQLMYVCGEVNSKNGFGGYGGWVTFRAMKLTTTWKVEWDTQEVEILHQLFVEDCGL